MTELPEFEHLPQAEPARSRRFSPQLVWIIPIVAALIGGWLAVQAWLQQGPTITISFASAEGLEPGKTRIKYKDVDVGLVKSLALSNDRKRVVVTAEMTKQAENLLVAGTRFWVVRPRISGGNVSGLQTLLGGTYVGIEVGSSGEVQREFVGLDVPPAVSLDVPGRRFTLHGDDLGSLDVGSPVYLRRVQVGQVVAFELDKDGRGVTVTVFVRAPHDHHVGKETRFWQASGIDLNVDANGLKVDTQSLVTILLGGIAFETPPQAGKDAAPAAENATFALFNDRSLAMRSDDAVAETYQLAFRESVRGLNVGAPVDFRGLVVGEVTGINLDVDPDSKEVTVPVEIRLYPERLLAHARKHPGGKAIEAARLMAGFVERGLRAQLRTANLVSGQLYVALDFFPNAKKVASDPGKHPLELPTIPGSLEELQQTLASIAGKLDRLPLDDIVKDLRAALRSLDRTLQDTDAMVKRVEGDIAPEALATIADVRKTMAEARTTLQQAGSALGGDAPLQQNARQALHEVTRAAQALRTLADTLERNPESLLRGKQKEEQP